MIQRGSVRVVESGEAGRYFLRFETLGGDSAWHIVCATGHLDTVSIWDTRLIAKSEDPLCEWKEPGDNAPRAADGFFDRVHTSSGGSSLVLSRDIGNRMIEQDVAVEDGGRVHVRVRCTDREARRRPFELGRLMTNIYFVPAGKAARSTEPLDFAWLPLLHKEKGHVCGDHFFRSPAAIVACGGFFAALVPDLDALAARRPVGHALDLRVTDTPIEAPRLSYGLCPWVPQGHVYAIHPPGLLCAVSGEELTYEFDLFLGTTQDFRQVPRMISTWLWLRYGRKFLEDVRPQVLPFEEYGRRYVYAEELPRSVKWAEDAEGRRAGIDNADRRGANFHAWENDLNVAYGIKHYGMKWADAPLVGIADAIIRMYLRSPRRKGAFPCIFNFRTNAYEGTLFWTGRAVDSMEGFDAAAMGVTTWWGLMCAEDFSDDGSLRDAAASYARFLSEKQLPSGAVPAYFDKTLAPARQLLESATTCISGAVLARVARMAADPRIHDAALVAGRWVADHVVPGLVFDDFEAYYSCSPKPLHAIDYWTGIRPHCNLSIQWGCDQMLALYELTGDAAWLETGEYLLSILSLYQQVWSPPFYEEYLFGGFGVMNTDGEWNDGRQARFVATYADYYRVTGKMEYLERAVAACRASFALCDMPENHANGINGLVIGKNVDPRRAACGNAEPGKGYAPENIHHLAAEMWDEKRGYKGLWTGMNWSAGGGLAASAYLERHFGNVCVDLAAGRALGIDGFSATLRSWDGRTAGVEVSSPLQNLKQPFSARRRCRVTVQHAGAGSHEIVVNGESSGSLQGAGLSRGMEISI
jgi:hypothetical protein